MLLKQNVEKLLSAIIYLSFFSIRFQWDCTKSENRDCVNTRIAGSAYLEHHLY